MYKTLTNFIVKNIFAILVFSLTFLFILLFYRPLYNDHRELSLRHIDLLENIIENNERLNQEFDEMMASHEYEINTLNRQWAEDNRRMLILRLELENLQDEIDRLRDELAVLNTGE